jgi:hypothetical protein
MLGNQKTTKLIRINSQFKLLLKKEGLLKIMLFGLTVNTIFPFDKLLIIPFIIYMFIYEHIRLSKTQLIILFSLLAVALNSFVCNWGRANIEIFYPTIFLTGAFLISKSQIDLLFVRKIILVNIIFGLCCALLADFGIQNPYSRTLAEKGLPFLFGPLGFSPTNQVFGTFCILYYIISYEYKKVDWTAILATIGFFMSLNRCTIVFYFLLLCIYSRKLLMTYLCAFVAIFLSFKDDIMVLFSTGTIDSRNELRYGVELAYWKSHDLLTYLWGIGNSNTTAEIANKTIWGRTYVENGLDFILHSYGFIGLIVVSIIVSGTLLYLLINKQYKFFAIVSFYLIIAQWLTQEYLASSLMFFIGCIFLLLNNSRKRNPKNECNDSNINYNSHVECR